MEPTYAEQLREWLLRPVLAGQEVTHDQLHEVIHLLKELRAMAQVTQQQLDDVATGLVSTEGSLQTAIAQLQADIDAGNTLDLSGIQNAAAGLAALVPSTTGGGAGPVSDDPSAPVVDGSGDGSGGVGTEPTA